MIKYGTGEYIPAPRPKKKTRLNEDGSVAKGSHYTPSDIPNEKIKEEGQVCTPNASPPPSCS